MVSVTEVSRCALRQAFGPETLSRLMIIYDECLQELLTWYAGSQPSDLNGMEMTVAERIMSAAARGAIDPMEIRRQALRGLVPQRVRSTKPRSSFSAAS
jgi:hypothetical protein